MIGSHFWVSLAKNVWRTLFCLTVLACVVGCGQQKVGADISGYHWQRFTPKDQNFSVLFPKIPKIKISSEQTAIGKIEVHAYIAEVDAQTAYGMAFNDYPTNFDVSDPPKIFNESIKSCLKIGYQIISQTDEKVESYPGMKIVLGNGDFRDSMKIFLVGSRLYQLNSIYATNNPHFDDLEKFMNSFSLTQQ